MTIKSNRDTEGTMTLEQYNKAFPNGRIVRWGKAAGDITAPRPVEGPATHVELTPGRPRSK